MAPKRSGLGRGLDALLPKVDRDARQVPLDSLRLSSMQPRKRLDPEAIAELAASIAEKGVLQPLLVRAVDGALEIVAGERRYRAARQAGLATVPVIVREVSDRETLEIAIVENLQREDLTPVEEAHAFKQLLGFGLGQEEVAKAVGKSRSAVANALRLLSLPEEALAALQNGAITAGHARAILMQEAEHRSWALRKIVEGGLSVRQAERLKPPEPGSRPTRDASDKRHQRLEEELARHVGTKVKVQGGSQGRIELYFHSAGELERLLEVLGFQP